MYAIIKTGGKQYKVKAGETLKVEKLDLEAGKTFSPDVLLLGDEDGSNLSLGTPLVSGAKVVASVVEHDRHAKIQIVKYKPKSRYKRVAGHRQPYTAIKIDSIA